MAVNDSGRGYSPTPRGTGEPRLDHRPIEARKLGCLRESCVKRVLDIAVAATALTFLAPFFGLLVLIVRLDSPGPTFFSQRRVGRHGIVFTLWKVRSMYEGSSQSLHHQASVDWFDERRNGRRYKSDVDPRVTRVGRFLRLSSFDELPQLWNVLKGEMSLVGPRPVMDYERCHFVGWHFEREIVRPGITGLWQVSGRDRLSAPEMLALDVEYVRSRSFWLDMKILARTVPAVLGELHSKRASREPELRPQPRA